MRTKTLAIVFAALAQFAATFAKADVTPPTPPPPPAGYCSTIYNELYGDLQAFNLSLSPPPAWRPLAGGPTLYGANLRAANSDLGIQLTGPNYLLTVMTQLQEMQAMGIRSVMVEVGFPLLYGPFFGSQAAMQPYQDFYQTLAQNVHALGMKLIVENNVLNGATSVPGLPNLGSYYSSLSWSAYVAARADMAGTVTQLMQPDYLVLAEEPDNEALSAQQPNLDNPVLAAQMIAAEINAGRLASPYTQLGAGFGTWLSQYSPNGLMDYLNAYIALPLDYIDFHLYPINTEVGESFLYNTLIIASTAAAAGKPVAMSEGWPWKMEDSEWKADSSNVYLGRDPFSFWGPLDSYYLQTLQALANYTDMLYVAPSGTDYLFVYQTYGGTTANGGAATCQCTTASCDPNLILQTEDSLTATANLTAGYSSTGVSYGAQLIAPPDTTPPSTPASLNGTAGAQSVTLSWPPSTDNVGVAGYNVFRCSPTPCAGVWIANTASSSYYDSGLNPYTAYQWEVQAFDLANNHSALSPPLDLIPTEPLPPPPVLTGTIISPTQIQLSWTLPSGSPKVTQYTVYQGSSAFSLVPIRSVPGSTNGLKVYVSAATTYYFMVSASEGGLPVPSNILQLTTTPLPNPPDNIVASPVSATSIRLTWHETIPPQGLPIAHYLIYRGTSPATLTQIATVSGTRYLDTSLTPSTTYYYEIVAVDNAYDQSPPSPPISATTLPLPNPPNDVTVSAVSATSVLLRWQETVPPEGLPVARYLIYIGTSPGTLALFATVPGTTYTVRNLTPGTTYYLEIVAVDTAGDHSMPTDVFAFTTPAPPNPPVDLTAIANSSTRVTVTWFEMPPPGGLPISHYNVFRGPTATSLAKVGSASAPSYIDRSVQPETTYYYAVSTTDASGLTSPLSPPVSVTTP